MGREIVYCEGCGKRLTEDDFSRGKAQDHGNRPFCSACRPVTDPPAARPEGRSTERRTASGSTPKRRNSTERIPYAQTPSGGTPRRPASGGGGNAGVAWGVGVGLAVLVLIVVAVAKSGEGSHAAPPDVGVDPRAGALAVAEERLRELESFAASVSDPQAVLVRCDQLRTTFRDTPFETRFRQIEAQARERLKEKEAIAEVERLLTPIRKIVAEDREGARRAEVEKLFDAALRQAGPRDAEVRKLQSQYRVACEEADRRREAAKKPPRPWSECFSLGTDRTQANDYPGAKVLFLEGLATLPERPPDELKERVTYVVGLYNLACVYGVEAAKLADKAKAEAITLAFKYLELALQGQYARFNCACHPQTHGLGHMGEDKDLESIRSDPRYATLVKKYTP